MSRDNSTILYTLTDESPLLATASLLPIIRTFTAPVGIRIEKSDISLVKRILASFPDYLDEAQRAPDALAELTELTQLPTTNIIKLPNISASLNQLKAAITELQSKGFTVPDYPDEPETEDEKDIKARYAKVLGSAVNPVLREGNSDRRAPAAVKRYARTHPHPMGKWSPASRTHVAHMRGGDFYSSEKCMTMDHACEVRMDLVTKYGEEILLKE
jgi:isocitrate dehydrogenase